MSDENLILKIENLDKLRNPDEPLGFINWVRQNLDLYKDDEEVPLSHIRTYLKYIMDEVKSSSSNIDESNKSLWIKKIKRLNKGIKVLEDEK